MILVNQYSSSDKIWQLEIRPSNWTWIGAVHIQRTPHFSSILHQLWLRWQDPPWSIPVWSDGEEDNIRRADSLEIAKLTISNNPLKATAISLVEITLHVFSSSYITHIRISTLRSKDCDTQICKHSKKGDEGWEIIRVLEHARKLSRQEISSHWKPAVEEVNSNLNLALTILHFFWRVKFAGEVNISSQYVEACMDLVSVS